MARDTARSLGRLPPGKDTLISLQQFLLLQGELVDPVGFVEIDP